MQKLTLEPSYREYLEFNHSLVVDAAGNESLAGLSYSESIMYLDLSLIALQDDISVTLETMELFLVMYERHMAAARPERGRPFAPFLATNIRR